MKKQNRKELESETYWKEQDKETIKKYLSERSPESVSKHRLQAKVITSPSNFHKCLGYRITDGTSTTELFLHKEGASDIHIYRPDGRRVMKFTEENNPIQAGLEYIFGIEDNMSAQILFAKPVNKN